MVIEVLFLCSALALPPQSAYHAKLDAFFNMYKGYDIYMTDEKGHPEGKGWERSKFEWEGMSLWVKKAA